MILKISEWLSYLPLIGFIGVILAKKREKKKSLLHSMLQVVVLVVCVFMSGFLFSNLIGRWADVRVVPYLVKPLRWNIHNMILFLIFMMVKIRNSRRKKSVLFGVSIVSCIFVVTQIVFYSYLFLSNLNGLTPEVIGIVCLCSNAILFIQGAMLELMERNMAVQNRQNQEEQKLMEKKYEQDYYQLTMEQKESVAALQEEMKTQLLKIEKMIEQSESENEEEDIQRLIMELEEKVGKVGKVVFCSDSVLNTMLSLKYAAAQKAGLNMNICVDSYAKTKVEDFDLCSIITNLLDNAIEAAKRVKETGKEAFPIEVHIGQRAGYLVLKVKNSMLDPIKKNKKGEYITSKKESGRLKKHGRGVAIVENALKKYGGILRFEEGEGQMTVLAFLPILKKLNEKIEDRR